MDYHAGISMSVFFWCIPKPFFFLKPIWVPLMWFGLHFRPDFSLIQQGLSTFLVFSLITPTVRVVLVCFQMIFRFPDSVSEGYVKYDLCKDGGLCPHAKGTLRHLQKTRFSKGSLPGFLLMPLALVSLSPLISGIINFQPLNTRNYEKL
jgi:hypothetical protein